MSLKEKLLSIGGTDIFSNQLEHDPDAGLLLEKGKVFEGYKAYVEMKPHQCHWNVSALFENKIIDYIVIGYALNSDDVWFQHTWGLKDGVIIDTAEVNFLHIKTYFGIVLDDPNSFVELCKNNPAGSGKVRRISSISANR